MTEKKARPTLHHTKRKTPSDKPPPKSGRTTQGSGKKPVRKVRVSGSSLAVLDHPETVAEWDDEELARGQRRDKNGSFTGRAPKVLPREVYLELQRRYIEKAAKYFLEHAEEMAGVLYGIAMNADTDPRARVQAATQMLDRALGKPSNNTKLDVTVHEPKFIQALEGAIVSIEPGSPDDGGDDDIIDAEIVSDENAA